MNNKLILIVEDEEDILELLEYTLQKEGYETIGFLAPVLVLILRLLQGLALGGEYGGAATYVAEYSQPHRRGYWTSWIQTTATAGLFISLIVILVTKTSLSAESLLISNFFDNI